MKINYPQQLVPIEFSAATRQRFIGELSQQQFDLCVIGGGATGAGIAREAVLRGLKVVLIEKNDFAAGTSSKSSKLIHGGLRYLKQYRFGLVREALRERYTLMHLAPHLVSRLPCLYPIYRSASDGYWKIKAGITLYDLLCGTRHIGYHHMYPAAKVLEMAPPLASNQLIGGAVYYDAKTDDTRLVLATVQAAVAAGCRAINHFEAREFEVATGRTEALRVRDNLNGNDYRIRARIFVNAGGPWSDEVRALAESEFTPRVRPTLGVHLLIPWSLFPVDCAIMLISPIDGRPFYTIPCRPGNVVMIGSTDTDYHGDKNHLFASSEDIDYLLASFRHYFPEIVIEERQILSTFAGLRPLIFESGKSTTETSREHYIFEAPAGLIHLIGGKLTTYRRMAGDVMRYLSRHYNLGQGNAASESQPLYGGEVREYRNYAREKQRTLIDEFDLPQDVAGNLVSSYGGRVDDLLALFKDEPMLKERLVAGLPFIWGQLTYAVRHEMVLTLDDFLVRRIHILSLDPDQGRMLAAKVAATMAPLLGWDQAQTAEQVDRYLNEVQGNRKFRRTT